MTTKGIELVSIYDIIETIKAVRDRQRKEYDTLPAKKTIARHIVSTHIEFCDQLLQAIENTHPEDVAPIVYCGKCRYRQPPTDYCERLHKAYVPDDFYCKYGKRKDGNDNGDT